MDLDKLDKLSDLYKKGALTEEEFQKEKQKLKDADNSVSGQSVQPKQPEQVILMGLEESRYMCLMNAVLLFPSVGWIVSLVLWIAAQNKSEQVNQQGKYIANWLITYFIFFILLFIFSFGMIMSLMFGGGIGNLTGGAVFMLIPSLFIAFICILFPILGAIKSLDGVAFRYPLTIHFFK